MRIFMMIVLVCVTLNCVAQTNYVKNPDFELYKNCPIGAADNIDSAKDWNALKRTLTVPCVPEYCQTCTGSYFSIPDGGFYYQFPHSGQGMARVMMYYDEYFPPPTFPDYDYSRDYLRGKLLKKLTAGREYCVSLYSNIEESAEYGINKIGAYLDNGSLDTVSKCALPITFVTPQVFSSAIIDDTANWIKVEGHFIANGSEEYITIGNFFSKSSTMTINMPGATAAHWSYYLIDDVSVIPLDLTADAGPDRNVPLSKTNQIGRVGDSTAIGLDCKWFHKGKLIDSGAVITVTSGASVGSIDTYVVVQTVCGLVKMDTMLLRTVPTNIGEIDFDQSFSSAPNPSSGKFQLRSLRALTQTNVRVLDQTGRVVYQNQLSFSNNEASLNIDVVEGIYLLEISNPEGEVYRQKIEIRK